MEALKSFISLLVIINPIGAIPIFISLTSHQSDKERKRTIRLAAFAVAAVLTVTGLIGERVIALFGISIASFQVGGGILILLVAITMLNAQVGGSKQTSEERVEAEHKPSIAVVPLAIPLLAGPGAMSTVIIHAQKATHWYDFVYLVLSAGGIGIICWLSLKMAAPISRILGQTGINIATRIMGLLLAAISVEFMVDGLTQMIPALQRH
ncbi:YchE family NAAT transporter [Parachitinimonas caeni]|uniref:UPF0056 membrane protein n=1 Tax=Parachitinimonas caeni TaxID=3031301 RepID=A0ABT7E3N7_9NEIS|nr:YchE family NAAT transporter [Parachitinimonas caeni]MDK2125517.1 YchE family NAAT transporter [Parachitinimonas caeni]